MTDTSKSIHKSSPHCSKCRNHGIKVSLKGHKHKCQWKACECQKCILVLKRREIMAAQLALRRKQDSSTLVSFEDETRSNEDHKLDSQSSIYSKRKDKSDEQVPENTKRRLTFAKDHCTAQKSAELSQTSSPLGLTQFEVSNHLETQDQCTQTSLTQNDSQAQPKNMERCLRLLTDMFPEHPYRVLHQLFDIHNKDLLFTLEVLLAYRKMKDGGPTFGSVWSYGQSCRTYTTPVCMTSRPDYQDIQTAYHWKVRAAAAALVALSQANSQAQDRIPHRTHKESTLSDYNATAKRPITLVAYKPTPKRAK